MSSDTGTIRQPLMFEIHGANFFNKGAELMLIAVITALRQRFPQAQYCMRYLPPYRKHLEKGIQPLWSLGPSSRYEGLFKFVAAQCLADMLPGDLFKRHGIVRPAEVDALIDISGFAYGDHFPVRFIHALYEKSRFFRQRGKPVILLPQMFGPFTGPEHRKVFGRALECASLVYSRDAVSQQHAQSCATSDIEVRRAPDITLFLEPEPPPSGVKAYACLVPNSKMISHGGRDWEKEYVGRLSVAAKMLLEAGLELRIVLHETSEQDRKLAEELRAQLDPQSPVLLVQEDDPLKLKSLIYGSKLLVGSRFHAMVSALSGGVPVIILGWSHKYDQLAADFGIGNYVSTPNQTAEDFRSMIARLLVQDEHVRIRNQLVARKAALREDNTGMWQAAFKLIEKKSL